MRKSVEITATPNREATSSTQGKEKLGKLEDANPFDLLNVEDEDDEDGCKEEHGRFQIQLTQEE